MKFSFETSCMPLTHRKYRIRLADDAIHCDATVIARRCPHGLPGTIRPPVNVSRRIGDGR